MKRRGNTIPNRIAADARYPHPRVAYRDDGGCLAALKLGETWARSPRFVHCSRRALPDRLFCGQHDHLNLLSGDDVGEFLHRAFSRAGRSGLRLRDDEIERADAALADYFSRDVRSGETPAHGGERNTGAPRPAAARVSTDSPHLPAERDAR